MNHQQEESPIEAAQGSIGGIPPIQTGQSPAAPQADDNDDATRKAASPSSSGPIPDAGKAPVSPKKLEANRLNAQKSTGPRTEEGKAKAAANSYRHGFFAKHLFLNAEQWAKDKADYETVADGIIKHYQPVGYMENFWAEKIATEALRFARLIHREQEVLDWRAPFENRSPNCILRYQAAINRQLVQAIEELERLQAKRKAASIPLEAPRPAASDGQTDEQPTGSVATVAEPNGHGSEACGSNAAPRESSGTNPPLATAGNPSAGSALEPPSGGSHAQADDQLSPGSAQQGLSAGTNPRRSLADEISKKIDNEDLEIH